jgi:hypothetical protein
MPNPTGKNQYSKGGKGGKKKGAPKMNTKLGGKLYAAQPRRTSGKATKTGTFFHGKKSRNSSN